MAGPGRILGAVLVVKSSAVSAHNAFRGARRGLLGALGSAISCLGSVTWLCACQWRSVYYLWLLRGILMPHAKEHETNKNPRDSES
ncbi:hypothetical protein NDU88_010710 [Pleurodeles waltl]|uniref:Uncharacterized protein n=1 Tax=Pleurodeles waltl TaxID=8319 RepID=A0AAV7PVP8_PLEWA|nr:hypothetical protein NDU88_010710 [Pleurodeles waltl]